MGVMLKGIIAFAVYVIGLFAIVSYTALHAFFSCVEGILNSAFWLIAIVLLLMLLF